MYDEELNNILEHANSSGNELVLSGLKWERKFRNKTAAKVMQLRNDVSSIQEKNEIDFEGFVKTLKHNIVKEINYINELNKKVSSCSYPLKTNKMLEALTGAKELIENHLEELLDGKLPEGYRMEEQLNPFILANNSSIYGCSTGTYLKTALLEIKKHLFATTNLWSNGEECWVDKSAIAHIVPIPENIDIGEFKDSGYYFSDSKTQNALMTIQSAYAFGGHRYHERYPNGHKEFGPEDCSSWVAKLTNCRNLFSTADQEATYRYKVKRDFTDQDKLLQSSTAQEMINIFDADIIKDPQKDIKPGKIYILRKFNKNDPEKGLGSGGHTAIVLGSRSNGQIVTLGDGRDMAKNKEGYGIEEFSWTGKIDGELIHTASYLKVR